MQSSCETCNRDLRLETVEKPNCKALRYQIASRPTGKTTLNQTSETGASSNSKPDCH